MKRTGIIMMTLAVLAVGPGRIARGDDSVNRTGMDSLIEKLKSACDADRQRNIEELIKMGDACLPAVNAVLLEEDEQLQRKIAELIKQLGHDDWEKREEAHKQLVSIGLKALTQVTEGMRNNDREIAYRCSQIKIKIEERSVEEVVKRRKQFTALLFVAKSLADRSSLEALHKCCKDSEKAVRIAAVDAVAAMADPSSVDVLVELLNDDDIHIRLLAGSGVTRIKSDGARTRTLKILLDTDENVYLRRLAAIALGNYGDKKAIGELIQVMDDDSYVVRYSVLKALQTLSGLKDETFGYDYRGDGDAARAARAAAIKKWRLWWEKEGANTD